MGDMNPTLTLLARLPKPAAIGFSLLLTVAIGWIDYEMGFDIRVTGFYLAPICWVCWAAGRQAGIWLSVVTAATIGFAEALSHVKGLHLMIPVWNALMMLAVFLVTAFSMTAFIESYRQLAQAESRLRTLNEGLEQTVQQRTEALRMEMAERRRAEQEKYQAEQLLERQEKLATLGTLTAGIAHEIRNPLTSLKARLYTLEKHLHAVPAARRDTDIITAEISRLERIVQEALSFARPADPTLERIPVDTLLREVHGLMSTSLEGRGVSLVLETEAGLTLKADSGHLKQVLVNLVRNAGDAIEGSGTITLRSRRKQAVLQGAETEAVFLEVEDTGKGIPPEIEKRLFDPFFSTKDTGTGLGLPIAARLVEKHGGRIEYRTLPGKGTTFSVLLPTVESDLCRPEAATKPTL